MGTNCRALRLSWLHETLGGAMSEMTTYERYRLGQAYVDAGDPLAAARVLEPAVEAEATSAALWLGPARGYAAFRPARRSFVVPSMCPLSASAPRSAS